MTRIARPISLLLIVALLGLTLHPPAVSAVMIGTERMIEGDPAQGREVERSGVVRRLVDLGVEPAEAERRVAALSDGEVELLAGRLDTLPAGGDLIGGIIFIFLVLLVTDILGYTDVYPFVKRTVNGEKR